jgi:LCP family protein required for cell wall assembly
VSARVLVGLLSAAVLCTTGVGWATVGSLERNVTSTDVLSAVVPHGPGNDGATDILLVGNDSRTDAQGRPLPPAVLRTLRTEQAEGINTDTIIVVRVPDNGTAAHAVSIPRDTYVTLPDSGSDKINSVYGVAQAHAARQLREQGVRDETQIARDSAHAGRRALVRTVEQLTEVRIDHYAEVNLYGFYLLTQAIGGVEVCLNGPTTDPGSGANFAAGRQTLSGGDALSFVRQRGGLPRGDLDRIVRQQVFLASAVNEVLSAGTLTNPQRLAALVAAAQSSIVLDEDWDMLGFAQQLHGLAAGSVDFVTIPVLDVAARNERGQSIITVDPAQVREFVAGLAGSAPAQTTTVPAVPTSSVAAPPAAPEHTVDVRNGTDVAGLAGQVLQRLVAAGFTAGKTGNTTPRQFTMIKVAADREAVGEQISELLGGGIPVLDEPTLAGNQIVVLLGSDYPTRAGARLAAGPLPRPDGSGPPPPATAPHSPSITADGVPCIN